MEAIATGDSGRSDVSVNGCARKVPNARCHAPASTIGGYRPGVRTSGSPSGSLTRGGIVRMRPTARLFAVVVTTLLLGGVAAPAGADHTNPRQPLSPIVGGPAPTFITQGIGTWRFIRNFPANPGTDLKFFTRSGEIYASSGTLGQGNEGHVGQRVIQLTDDGVVDPEWVADHGSAHCTLGSTGVTGLQHDVVRET